MTDRPRRTDADLVVRVGDALYGHTAVNRLASGLPMAKRTVERIFAAHREGEDYPAAEKALNDLPRLIDEKKSELDQLAREVFRAQMRR